MWRYNMVHNSNKIMKMCTHLLGKAAVTFHGEKINSVCLNFSEMQYQWKLDLCALSKMESRCALWSWSNLLWCAAHCFPFPDEQAVPCCLEAVLSHPNNVFLDILGSGRIQTWLLEQFVYKPHPFIVLGVHFSFNSGVLLLLWAMGKLATLFLTTEILFVFYSVLISSSFLLLLQLCSFYSW